MNGPLTIERLRAPSASDREAIIALEAGSFSNPWTAETFDQMLAVPVTELFVTRAPDGSIVAFCSSWLIEDELHINTIAVAPARRRQGIASRMLREMLQVTGAKRATLEVRQSNAAALRLYERLGFVITAVRPRYYEKPEENGLILWLNP